MNPILIFYVFLAGFVIWALSAWMFPKIGEFINVIIDYVKSLSKEDEEDE